MSTPTTNPTKEQFEAKIAELREERFKLTCTIAKTSTEEFFIQEELDGVEGRIRRYTKRMIELYGA